MKLILVLISMYFVFRWETDEMGSKKSIASLFNTDPLGIDMTSEVERGNSPWANLFYYIFWTPGGIGIISRSVLVKREKTR